MSLKKPRVLIVGDSREGSFERELLDFLTNRSRVESCKIEPKTALDLSKAAEESDLVLMFVGEDPPEAREESLRALPLLGGKDSHLLLFAEDRASLLDAIDDLDMSAHRVFRLTSKVEWQRRLLDEVLEWIIDEEEAPKPTPHSAWSAELWKRTGRYFEQSRAAFVALTGLVVAFTSFYGAVFAGGEEAQDGGPNAGEQAEQAEAGAHGTTQDLPPREDGG